MILRMDWGWIKGVFLNCDIIELQCNSIIAQEQVNQHQNSKHSLIYLFYSMKSIKITVTQSNNWPCMFLQDRYQLKDELGHGTYGSVYKAFCKQNQKYYALKKMEQLQDKSEIGFPITTFRQIKLLQTLSHPNILGINEVVFQKSRSSRPPIIYLCLDLMSCDLDDLISNKQYMMDCSRIQTILRNILEGLKYLHSEGVAHRDLKPSNILINEQGSIKIADFGLAKKLGKIGTIKVVTLWYRAPQLLLGVKNYSVKVDVWAVGCIAAEFLLRKPLFEEQHSEREVIERMFKLMGTPDECGFQEEIASNQQYLEVKPDFSCRSEVVYHLKKNTTAIEGVDDLLFDLIEKMLRMNPKSRLSAEECLEHPFFSADYPQTQLLPKAILQKKQIQNGADTLRKKVKQ